MQMEVVVGLSLVRASKEHIVVEVRGEVIMSHPLYAESAHTERESVNAGTHYILSVDLLEEEQEKGREGG